MIKLIKDDQNGFRKGRNFADNIRLMFDVVDYANSKNISGSVLSVDLCTCLILSSSPLSSQCLNSMDLMTV